MHSIEPGANNSAVYYPPRFLRWSANVLGVMSVGAFVGCLFAVLRLSPPSADVVVSVELIIIPLGLVVGSALVIYGIKRGKMRPIQYSLLAMSLFYAGELFLVILTVFGGRVVAELPFFSFVVLHATSYLGTAIGFVYYKNRKARSISSN